MAPVGRGTFVSIEEDSGSSSDEDETAKAKRPKLNSSSDGENGSDDSSDDSSDSEGSDDSSDSEGSSSSGDTHGDAKPNSAQVVKPSPVLEESSSESSDSSDDEDGVIGRLKAFLASSERTLTLKGTSTLERKLAHTWVETHQDKAVRSWGHVAKLVGTERVMTITKPDEYANATGATKAIAKVTRAASSTKNDDSSDDSDSDSVRTMKSAAQTAPANDSTTDDSSDSSDSDSSDDDDDSSDSSTGSGDGSSVASKLERFARSSEHVLTISGTTGPERAAIHKWVETHADPAVRRWSHVSKTVGPDRLMTVTKTGSTESAAQPSPKAQPAAVAKPDSTDDRSDSSDDSDSDSVRTVKSAAQTAPASSHINNDSTTDDSSDSDSSDGDDDSSDSSTGSGDGSSVASKLERFARSSEHVLTISGTTGPERAAIHKWVETHADPAVRRWSHVSKTVGPDRLMTVTKTGSTESAAQPSPKAQPAAVAKPDPIDDDSDDDNTSDGSDESDDDSSSGPTQSGSVAGQDLTTLLKAAEAAKMKAFSANKFDDLPGLQAEINRINGLLAHPNPEHLKAQLAAAEAAKMAAFDAKDFAALPDYQKQIDRLAQMLKSALPPAADITTNAKTKTANRFNLSSDAVDNPSSAHAISTSDSGSKTDSVASATSDSSTDDSASESDSGSESEDEADVIIRLKSFRKSSEKVLILEDTTAPDRSAVHKWVEAHEDPIVRGWGHTSKTVGTRRVMTVTKNPGDSGISDGGSQKKRRDSDSSIEERPLKKSRGSLPAAENDGATGRRFDNGKYILFVGQLPYDATASQIQGHFQTDSAAEIMGGQLDIIGVRLLTDKVTGKSRGMAFVDCGSEEDLDRGVHLHQSKLLGRRINVEKSASGGGKTDRRKRFIQKSKEEYEEIRRARVAEALESRLRRSDHELGEDDVDEEIRGFLLSVPVHIAVEALDEFHTAVIKTPPTSRRAYLMGVLKRLHNETDSTMPLNKRRGHDRKKGGGGSRAGGKGGRGGGHGRGSSSFASGGIGGAFGASGRGRRGGSGRAGSGRGSGRGSKW